MKYSSKFYFWLAVCCSAVYTEGSYSIVENSAKAINEDGGIRITFSLNLTIVEGTNQTIFFDCTESDDMGDESSGAGGAAEGCDYFEASDAAQDCCENCIAVGNSSLSHYIAGPVNAGQNYSCDILGSISSNGTTSNIMARTGTFTATTGIPSRPGFTVEVQKDGTLSLLVGSEHSGTADGTGLTYEVIVQSNDDEDRPIVTSTNSTMMNFSTSPVCDEGNYIVTVWVENEYGRSENDTKEILITDDVVCPTYTSTTPTTTPTERITDEPSDSGSNVGAIVGGVVGGVVAVVAVAVIVTTVVALVVTSKSKKGVLKVVPLKK